jgi:drug/metabolite transporter (DMT)-like permease
VFTIIALAKNIKSGTLEEYLSLPFANFDFFIVVLYLSIGCSLLAFLLYNMAVELIGTTRAISFVGVSTIVTVMAGIIILKEKFSATQGDGTALVIGGVYLANKIPESRTSVNKGCNNITAVRGKEL